MILFERKFERARKFQREQNEARKSDCTGRDDLELTDVMEKGDTLATISKEKYGNTSQIDAICKMNGLEDGNLIFIGQKLLLP